MMMKRKEKNIICKKISSVYGPSSLSMKCLNYEMSYLWNALSMKCPIYKMSYLWNALSMNFLSIKCLIYEMSYLWNVLSMILLSMNGLSLKCPNAQYTLYNALYNKIVQYIVQQNRTMHIYRLQWSVKYWQEWITHGTEWHIKLSLLWCFITCNEFAYQTMDLHNMLWISITFNGFV